MKTLHFISSLCCLAFLLSLSACELFEEIDDEPNLRAYDDFVEEQDEFPAWSPDGEHIAYYHFSSQFIEPENYPSGLYIIDKDGGNRQLVLEGTGIESPSWSPDGDSLVFSNRGVIQKCAIDGSGLTSFVPPDDLVNASFFFTHWSPSGNKIIVTKPFGPEGGLYEVNAAFIEIDRPFGLVVETGSMAELSRNSTKMVYAKGDQSFINGTEIFTFDIVNQIELRITDNSTDDRYPTWSPDNDKIAWSANVQIHTMHADGTNTQAFGVGQYPSWSVNDKIVYSGPNAAISKEVLFVMNSDGSEVTQITF